MSKCLLWRNIMLLALLGHRCASLLAETGIAVQIRVMSCNLTCNKQSCSKQLKINLITSNAILVPAGVIMELALAVEDLRPAEQLSYLTLRTVLPTLRPIVTLRLILLCILNTEKQRSCHPLGPIHELPLGVAEANNTTSNGTKNPLAAVLIATVLQCMRAAS